MKKSRRDCARDALGIVAGAGIPILQSFGFCEADVAVDGVFNDVAVVQIIIANTENQVHVGFTSWAAWAITVAPSDGIQFRALVDEEIQDDAETRLNSSLVAAYESSVAMIHRFTGFQPGVHALRIQARTTAGATALLRTVQLAGQVLARGSPQEGD